MCETLSSHYKVYIGILGLVIVLLLATIHTILSQ